MTSVRQGKGDSWEIRESVRTDRGPRSRTLATFSQLTPTVLEHARARATRPFDAAAVEQVARRAGAPVAQAPADRAARDLLGELARGANARPVLARLVADLLATATGPVSDAVRAAAQWADATPRDRADALVDLLLLADAVPAHTTTRKPDCFPRISSVAATP